MKQIVSISLGPARRDVRYEAEVWGQRFLVRRLGTDGDANEAARLVGEHDGQVDCIALGGMSIVFSLAERNWVHRETLRIASRARTTPVVGGRALRRILDRWAVRELALDRPDLFEDRNVLFLSGIASWDAFTAMRELTPHHSFADPILHFGWPWVLRSEEALVRYSRMAMPLLTRRPYVSFFPQGKTAEGLQQRLLGHSVAQADVIVGDLRQILHHLPRDLTHKTIVTSSFDDAAQDELRERGVEVICGTTPPVLRDRHVDPWILHAMCVAQLGKHPKEIEDEDYLRLIRTLGGEDGTSSPRPRLVQPQGEPRRIRKFAYLYYPPSRKELFRAPALRWLSSLPDEAQHTIERVAARGPIFARSRVHGVVGKDGTEVDGWILYLPTTALEIEARGPAYAEARLLEASRIARRLGATLLGVVAFSRTMTRATREVASKIDLPITSGASYFVSATLWAVKEAAIQMGLEKDAQGRTQGTALVAGAGDPEAVVAAELLGLVFRRLILVDHEPDRLLSLSGRLARDCPWCEVQVTTRVAGHAGEADVVVWGFSTAWAGTLPLDELRPGCVVCDAGRPPEFDVAARVARPDVLFIRAGEVELPGPADLGADLGPPPKVAFASLAETVALSLSGRDECFTLGDAVTMAQVKEIYRLGLRHGMRLAAIRGIDGPVSETEIRQIRERALARRRKESRD